MALFEIRNLTFTYPGQEKPALTDLSFSLEQGEFLVVCGKSGCGKSTLLRHFKTAMSPYGERKGQILLEGRELDTVSVREQGARIGYVLQSPDNQLVTDKVWHELAFGLENLGYETGTIRLRVAEMASFFGIQTWFEKNVEELSGGQKQLLNLAAVMAMQPDLLVLDEPTSQLDPLAAGDFLATLRKINAEAWHDDSHHRASAGGGAGLRGSGDGHGKWPDTGIGRASEAARPDSGQRYVPGHAGSHADL